MRCHILLSNAFGVAARPGKAGPCASVTIAVAALAVLCATTPALADTEAALAAERTATPLATEARVNRLVAQAGVLPGLTFVGVELTHIVHPRFDVSVSAAFGLTMQVAVIPHLRVAAGRWTFGVGVGPGLGYIELGEDTGSGVWPELLGEATIAYETKSHYLWQLRGGALAFCDGSDGVLDCSDVEVTPFAGIGFGKAF